MPGTVLIYAYCPGVIIKSAHFHSQYPGLDYKLYSHPPKAVNNILSLDISLECVSQY